MGEPINEPELLDHTAAPNPGKIDIITLGDFDILFEGQSLLAAHKRSYRILELLQYLITFRDQRLLPEAITDQLQPGSDFADPKGVLRIQVHRLRKILDNMHDISDSHGEPWLHLSYSGGSYLLTLEDQCRVDSDLFRENIQRADSILKEDPPAAMDLYERAVAKYKGKYMAGPGESEWLLPWQNRFHRLYLRVLLRLLGYLYQEERYYEIIDIYERATMVERYDEGLHIYFLQALLAVGDQKSALSHYNYITSFLYKELGVKPSSPFRALYRRLQTVAGDHEEIDLAGIEKRLTGEDILNGALGCDIDYFQFLWQLEKRRSQRDETNDMLGLITFSVRGGPLPVPEIQALKEKLTAVLAASLRRGDVFTWWKENQILIFLRLGQRRDLAALIPRLRQQLEGAVEPDRIQISMRFRPLSEEGDLLG